ncbi:MAG: hypothetical protein Q8O40_07750 [Chloroflexota bacterium]|nr:hypothetical protein [Chloroflexota bacterium]
MPEAESTGLDEAVLFAAIPWLEVARGDAGEVLMKVAMAAMFHGLLLRACDWTGPPARAS